MKNDLPENISEAGNCSECGVGPLELCPPCGEAYDRHVDRICGKAMVRARWKTLPVRLLIGVVRGLRRLFEALSGRRGS